MSYLILFAAIVVFLVLMVSHTRWKLSKERLNSLNEANFAVYKNKAVSASAQLKAGQTLGIPINSSVFINDQEIHLIPNKFYLSLFMTDFPFSFYKKHNKKFKIRRSELSEIVFSAIKKETSIFGKEFEVTIKVFNEDEKLEMLRKLRKWR